MADEVIRYDFNTVRSDGTDSLTTTLLNLLNEYPGMSDSIVTGSIRFQLLDNTSGVAMFASPSVAILNEKIDVIGHVEQRCAYNFTVVFRTRISASGKEKIKEWLDDLGRWLEEIKYPSLGEDMEFLTIRRTAQASLYSTTSDKAEDWALPVQATYRNEFDK